MQDLILTWLCEKVNSNLKLNFEAKNTKTDEERAVSTYFPALIFTFFILITNSLALVSEEASSDFINLSSTAFHSEIGRGPETLWKNALTDPGHFFSFEGGHKTVAGDYHGRRWWETRETIRNESGDSIAALPSF